TPRGGDIWQVAAYREFAGGHRRSTDLAQRPYLGGIRMATAAVLERTPTLSTTDRLSAWSDWEAPAGGPPALPLLTGVSFRYVCTDGSHLQGQACLAIERVHSDSETCLVAFACGCRAGVARRLLRPC